MTICANIQDREMSRDMGFIVDIAKPWYCREYCSLQTEKQ